MLMYFSDENILCKLQSSMQRARRARAAFCQSSEPLLTMLVYTFVICSCRSLRAQSKAPRAFPLSKSKFRESRIEFCSSQIPRSLADLILTYRVSYLFQDNAAQDLQLVLTCRPNGPVTELTELRKFLCTWFGEVCFCCCLSLLPQLAYIILATTYKEIFSAL